MTTVAIELLTRPPKPADVPGPSTLPGLGSDAVEFAADTDTLLTIVLVQREQ